MEALFSFCATEQGFLHLRQGIPCEDASGSRVLGTNGCTAFVVADGHGDPSCTRSALGSQMAVRVTLDRLEAFATEYADALPVQAKARERALADLREGIAERWKTEVRAHYAAHELTTEESAALSERAAKTSAQRCERLYGTTLVAGVKLRDALVLLQQGDGCCAVLFANGEAVCPIPADERCAGNVTTSLCDKDSGERMRSCVLPAEYPGLAACFVGSDGVDKSLVGAEGLLDFCRKCALDTLGAADCASYEATLRPLLASLSEQGAGDDISMAGFVDTDAVARIAPILVERRRSFVHTLELASLKSELTSMRRAHERYLAKPEAAADEGRAKFMEDFEQREQRVRELEGLLAEEAEAQGDLQTEELPVVQAPEFVRVPLPAVVQTPVLSSPYAGANKRLAAIATVAVLVALLAGFALGLLVGMFILGE